MKKIMNIFLAVLITLFSFPIGGLNVSAEGKEQKVDYIVKHATDDKESAADNFFTKPGMLIEKDGKLYLQVTITSWSMVEALSSEGTDVTVLSENDNNTAEVEIELNKDLSTATNLKMTINVPGLYNTTHDARLFILDENDTGDGNGSEVDNEDKDDGNGEGDNSSGEGNEDDEGDSEDGNNGEDGSEGEGNEEGNENGEGSGDNGSNTRDDANLIKESEVESVETIEPISSLRLSGYFEAPFKLLNYDGKRYVQIKGKGMGHMLTSLTVDGEEVIWGEVKEDGTYTVQFEWEGALSKVSTLAMTIDTGRPGFGVMTHSGTLSFGKNYNLNDEIDVTGDEIILLDGVQLIAPTNIPNDVVLKVTEQVDIETPENLERAGKVYDFDFDQLPDNFKGFKLVMDYDANTYNDDEYDVDIYWYDEDTKEWKAQKGTAENGVVSLDVNHFSTYGVFAQKKDTTNDDKQKSDELKVYEIDYVVKHETKDENSSANAFFQKPGILLKQDGDTYFQTYITSWEMIGDLKYNGKDVQVISVEPYQNGERALVQMKIDDDLDRVIPLSMHVSVPGMYSMEHDARLVFDKNSKKEINAKGYKIYKEDDSKGSGGQGGGATPPAGKPGGGKGQGTTQKSVVKSDKVAADKVHKIDYAIWHAVNDEPSAADGFFQKPGFILEKDGKKYLQFTVTSWSMVNWLKANGKDVLVISEDKKNDTATIQLRLDGDLTDVIQLSMKITVPGLYEMEHDARLILDPDSAVEVDPTGHYIYTNVAKPGEFGKADGEKKSTSSNLNPTNNPKTGDTSQLMFFTLLLIGSLITLSIQIKKRLA